MNGTSNLKSCKRLTWIAVLTAAMVAAFTLPMYAQQEVDPTWYDPSGAPIAAQPAQSAQKAHVRHAKAKNVSTSKRVAKASGKKSANVTRPS